MALAAGPIVGTRTLDGPHTDPVTTAQGDVVGVHDASARVDAFAGIPYAAPPVGDLRWEAPQPAPARSETLVADDFGTSVVQAEPSFVTRAGTRVLDLPLEQTLLGGYATDEDSLRLNVWRPSEAPPAPLPVLVYLHGGGFVAGSGALPAYDGTALASTGRAVVVTINYRLGVFGFLGQHSLGRRRTRRQHPRQPGPARPARRPAVGARQHRRVRRGPGAGHRRGGVGGLGRRACILGVSPLATGLVHGLIGESGGCLGSAGDRDEGDLYDDAEHAREAARGLSDALGGATLAEMREMPAERIAKAAAAADLATHWWPVVGDAVLPDTPSAPLRGGAAERRPPAARQQRRRDVPRPDQRGRLGPGDVGPGGPRTSTGTTPTSSSRCTREETRRR